MPYEAPNLRPYITGEFPGGYRAPEVAEGYRPGERMLHGAPYVSNSDTLNDYRADLLLQDAPADLTALTWEQLSTLVAAWHRRWGKRRSLATAGLLSALEGERQARREYVSFVGSASQAKAA